MDFPPVPSNREANHVPCPAFNCIIDDGLCWECCMADRGGPADTAEELRRWIIMSNQFGSIAEFQEVCARCPYCI